MAHCEICNVEMKDLLNPGKAIGCDHCDAVFCSVKCLMAHELERASHMEDFNESVATIQDVLGQEHGDFAGVYFSGTDYEDMWATYSATERKEVLERYAKAEEDFMTEEEGDHDEHTRRN